MDLDSSSLSTTTDTSSATTNTKASPRNVKKGTDALMNSAAARKVNSIIQSSSKLAKLQKSNSTNSQISTGLEKLTMERPKSARMFAPSNRDIAVDSDDDYSSTDASSDFALGPPPQDKKISTGLPPRLKAFKGDESFMDESVELVFKH